MDPFPPAVLVLHRSSARCLNDSEDINGRAVLRYSWASDHDGSDDDSDNESITRTMTRTMTLILTRTMTRIMTRTMTWTMPLTMTRTMTRTVTLSEDMWHGRSRGSATWHCHCSLVCPSAVSGHIKDRPSSQYLRNTPDLSNLVN